MPEDTEDRSHAHPTLALNTKVEADFVAPLTAIRGSLEILRDFKDLADDERERFLDTALRGCVRLEKSVEQLAKSVYDAGQQSQAKQPKNLSQEELRIYSARIEIFDDIEVMEIDFSNFVFSSSDIVNHFYDTIDQLIETTGRKWYLLVNYRDCSIWPEAWVAFAHRGQQVNVTYSLGTARYSSTEDVDESSVNFDPHFFNSRDDALAAIEDMKLAKTA